MSKPDVNKMSQQDEFHVDLSKVLEAFVDADEVQEGDRWGFVDGGEQLIIVRKRTVITDFKKQREQAAKDAKALEQLLAATTEENEE